jgi:hypothetical protein
MGGCKWLFFCAPLLMYVQYTALRGSKNLHFRSPLAKSLTTSKNCSQSLSSRRTPGSHAGKGAFRHKPGKKIVIARRQADEAIQFCQHPGILWIASLRSQ